MLDDDIILAQKIVDKSFYNFGNNKFFGNSSIIYKKSNEEIDNYFNFLNKRPSLLSVIASGDQILNSILLGSMKIDTFDISVFPKYFLYLKMASIVALTREEYIDFFYGMIDDSIKYDQYYERIRVNLPLDMKNFWDSLFDYFDWFDIYNSTLFSSEVVSLSNVITQNLFLQSDSNYYKLRFLLGKVVVHCVDGDVFNIVSQFAGTYDLVYLSNIIYYNNINNYLTLLKKIPLSDRGIILTYLYNLGDLDNFASDHLSFYGFPSSKAGVMIYHK